MTHNNQEERSVVEEILHKFKTTVMWETEHEEGLLMSNHDALEWLRFALTNLEISHHHQLQKARAEGYEQGYTQGKFDEKMDAEYKHPEELQKAREEARDQEARFWFETWYSHYIAPKIPMAGEFGKFATERIQMTSYLRDHSELDPLPTQVTE